jgi:23S rRNA pseudouridine955/2504/2580 synthase
MSDVVRQFTVGSDDDDIRLDRWFKRHLPQIGFATISRWARTGQIRVDGKRAGVEDRLAAGQVLRVPPGGDIKPGGNGPKPRRELTDEEIAEAEAMVLEQDRAAIVLNKPPGLATQGGSGTLRHVDGLLDAFCGPNEPRPRLVHRLDKDTSGVLLVARTPGSAAFFSRRFSGRTATKIYWALVVGVPDIADGLIELPIAKQPGTGGEKMHVDEAGGQAAKTRYRMIERAGNSAAWIELHPLTGRTHQLRVHMAAIGHPIVGDGKYGGQGAFLTGTISRKMHLHARRLVIEHPGGDRLDVTAPLPEHFAASMTQLGFSEELGEIDLSAPAPMSREVKKRAAKAHSKDFRKERRGERRKRGASDKPDRARPARPTGKKAPATKAASRGSADAKPGGGKPGTGKPAAARKPGGARPGLGKSATGKPTPRKPSAPRSGGGKPGAGSKR